ncbi:hypothetical protein [Prevotella sp. AM42-24]|uniref:hypothetical protein n=1 Tax=Prevotella sp. AM42-24 TaxID=2293125 RepID=UPI0011C15BEF|nr:hypothetical protein [Prevotella sp. AM42-24]
MKNKSILVSLLSMAVMFFAACGDSSNDPVDPNPGGGNAGGGTETIVTAAQAKQSLDRTSQELLSKISANEFEEYKQMLDVDVSDKAGVIQDWFEACVEACEIKANPDNHLWNAANFVGEFELQQGTWVQTKKGGDHLSFIYHDAQQKKCVITLKASAEATEIHHSVFDDEDWEWTGSQEIVTRYENRFMLPKQIDITATREGKNMGTVSVTSQVKTGKEVDLSKDEVDVTSVVTIGAYKAEVKKAVYKAGKTAEAKVVFSKNGEELITLEGNGNGNITPSGEKSEFGQINITINILGKAKVVYKILDGNLYYNNLSKADDNDGDESMFKLFVENANKQVDAKLYLDGSVSPAAKIYLAPYLAEDYGTYKYWDYEYWLEFTDGSKYSYEDYFNEQQFKTVSDKIQSLIDDFKNLFDFDEVDDEVHPVIPKK